MVSFQKHASSTCNGRGHNLEQACACLSHDPVQPNPEERGRGNGWQEEKKLTSY